MADPTNDPTPAAPPPGPPPLPDAVPTSPATNAPAAVTALSTIIWSIGLVLAVIAIVTIGIFSALGLSNARELAKENQEVTVRLTNAISTRICACIDWRPPASLVSSQSLLEIPTPSGEACVTPLVPPLQKAWLETMWEGIVSTLPNAKSAEQTPWQLAQPSIYRINIPANANFQSSIAALNYAVADERLQSIRSAEESGRRASVFQIMIIAIGVLTTMVVSLRTMENLISPDVMRGFSIAAILLSALGTGAASLNAFYAPRESSVRQVRSLVQLKQLHQELYVYLSAERCDTSPMARMDTQTVDLTDPRARRIRLWHSQLQQIVGGADAPIPDASDNARVLTPSPSKDRTPDPTHLGINATPPAPGTVPRSPQQ